MRERRIRGRGWVGMRRVVWVEGCENEEGRGMERGDRVWFEIEGGGGGGEWGGEIEVGGGKCEGGGGDRENGGRAAFGGGGRSKGKEIKREGDMKKRDWMDVVVGGGGVVVGRGGWRKEEVGEGEGVGEGE